MLKWLGRHLRHSPRRRLLCPVGEVLEESNCKPPYDVRNRVLLALCHHRERESTASKLHSEVHPCFAEFLYLPLSGDTSDFVHPPGSDGLHVPGPAVPHRFGHLAFGIQFPIHDDGHNSGTSSIQTLSHRLQSLMMYANRLIECIISTVRTLLRVPFPQ